MAALVVGCSMAAGACGGPTPSATAAPPNSPPPATSADPTAGASAAATATPTDGQVVVDAGLLDVLPAAVDGFELVVDDETAADIADDPTTDGGVERLAVGLFLDPSDPIESDFAIVSIAGLRPGVFDAGWYRGWRETYDEAACEIADGLAPGSAEADIADHRTFIGTCVGGVHTYHVHLADPDRVIAITALGPGRYGEQVVAGLAE